VHQTVHKGTQAIGAYELNKYIAYVRELSNNIGDFYPETPQDEKVLWESLRMFVQMVAPVMPHIAEEVGGLLGFAPGLHLQGWPQADASLLVEETVKMSVQVNGKLRGHIEAAAGTSDQEVIQRVTQDPSLSKYVAQGWTKAIVVPGRVVNFVTE
jgi:leucyl-tRNA synthetase